MTYNSKDECSSCGEHLSAPHAPGCSAEALSDIDDQIVALGEEMNASDGMRRVDLERALIALYEHRDQVEAEALGRS